METKSPKMSIFYVNKYSLTWGCLAVELPEPEGQVFRLDKQSHKKLMALGFNLLILGVSVFRTEEEAKADFEKRKQTAIKQAQENLEFVKGLQFVIRNVPEYFNQGEKNHGIY